MDGSGSEGKDRDLALGADEDSSRIERTMNESGGMGLGESAGNLSCEMHQVAAAGPLAIQDVPQRFTFGPIRYRELDTVGLQELDRLRDAGVLQLGSGFEAEFPFRIGGR